MLLQNHTQLEYKIKNKVITISTIQQNNLDRINKDFSITDRINIFASGPSISDVQFTDQLLEDPAIFVNGSIELTQKYLFKSRVAYVISDARFIDHSPNIFINNYKGQPLFITQAVLDKILNLGFELVENYKSNIFLIHAVDRPLYCEQKNFIKKILKKRKKKLSEIIDTDIILDKKNNPIIGVSVDISKGFVEAGTVTYVATQLAYSLKCKNIYLYGVDLMNTNQPRFYEKKGGEAISKLDKAVQSRIIPSFELLAQTFKKRGVEVYNCSVVSKDLFKNLNYLK